MVNKNKMGLVFGAVLGGIHLVWAALVALGWGQAVWNFVLWAHMMDIPVTVGPFDATAAITLIIITAVSGYVLGYAAGCVWNKAHRH